MSDPFLAEIRIFAGDFAPRGWAFCDGQLMPIANNTALFSLIGITYGGDGQVTMALPDLKGRAPMHPGRGPGLQDRWLGEPVGTSSVTLLESQIPHHTHAFRASSGRGSSATPSSERALAQSFPEILYTSDDSRTVAMDYTSLHATGGTQAHSNMQPFLALNFIISLVGIYPSRS
ncbi:phage tail protein [Roseibium suaedae]|uniref:Microcystin-dependent protein n=1 Tax=Roseibium suaedae TaxID=735517 RepID=A0A1M7KGT1_9HYPH|nr:tail fiber protein [Roseibium suaedae]SHM64527.1 Microcystin-dependent protein [Roseibium suaedae]